MRMALRLAVALLVIACARPAAVVATLSAEDQRKLQKFADDDCRIVMGARWDSLAAEYTLDAVRMPPGAPAVEGRVAIRAYLDRVPPITKCQFVARHIEGNGQIAFMRATYVMTASPPGKPSLTDDGKILIVFRKLPDGSWARAADAWNSNGTPK